MKKRFRMLALLLSACMMLNLAPMSVLAAEVDAPVEVTAEATEQDNTENSSEESPVVTETSEEETTEEPSEEEADSEDKNDSVDSEEDKENNEDTQSDSEVTVDLESLEMVDDLDLEQELLKAEEKESKYLFTVDDSGKLCLIPDNSHDSKQASRSSDSKSSNESSHSNKIEGVIDIADRTDLSGGREIKYIPKEIFSGNKDITAVVIPASVGEMEEETFDGCTNLAQVRFENRTTSMKSFPNSLFRGCTSLSRSANTEDFILPSGLETIGDSCFQGCKKLSTINFANDEELTTIGKYAFAGCSSLDELNGLDKTNITKISTGAFSNTAVDVSVKFPSTLTTIEDSAFSGCEYLYRIDLSKISNGASLSIGQGAFENSGLRNINLPNSYKTLTTGLFADCNNLETITLGSANVDEGITKIESGAFKNCDNLKEVILKESVVEVDTNAFDNCNNIKTIKSYQGKALEDGNNMVLYHDSLPAINGLVIYGYSGNIEDWVAKHVADGVIFKTLYTGLTFDVNTQRRGTVKVSTGTSSVSVGDTAKITASPASGYTLISMTHGANKALVANNYSFTVTGADVTDDNKIPVNVNFVNASKANAKDGPKFKFEVDETNGITKAQEGSEIDITTEGQSVPLKIKVIDSDFEYAYSNPWLWSFTSSNQKCVKVDANGKIKTVSSTIGTKDGYATVTATLKANNKVKIYAKVYVNAAQTFNGIDKVSFAKTNKTIFTKDEATDFDTIVVSKAWVELATKTKNTRNVDVTIEGVDDKGLPMEMAYTWKSANPNIAKVAADTLDSTNTVKICGVGETVITATSKEKAASTKKNASISFIVRVVDKTPIVADSAIVINSKSTSGTEFDIVRAYNGKISDKDIKIVTQQKGKWIENDKDFQISVEGEPIERADGDYSQTLNLGLFTDSSYIGKETSINGLYVKALVDDSEYVYIKLPTVKITAKAPAPKVTLVGKINTFYKANPTTKKDTSVTAKIAKVASYEWDTSKVVAIESLETDTDNIFEDNFDVEMSGDDFSEVLIYQKAETLKVDSKNKPVLTGYLVIPYKGNIYSRVKITIATQKVAPAYSLSTATVVTHRKAQGQEFDIQLLDKKTKDVIDLTRDYSLDKYGADSTAIFTAYAPTLDVDKNLIKVKVPSGLQSNGKAIIVLKNKNWAATLTYKLNVNVASANPVAIFGTKKITINAASTIKNSTTVKVKESYLTGVNVDDEAITPKSTAAKVIQEANKIGFDYNNGKLEAFIKDANDKPNAGKPASYVYRVPYTFSFCGGETFTAFVDITVAVEYKTPQIALKTTKFTLNDYLVGVKIKDKFAEVTETPYTVNNFSESNAKEIQLDKAELIDVTKAKDPKSYGIGEDKWSAENSPIHIEFKGGNFSIHLNNRLNGGTKKYKLTGVKVDGVPVADIIFSVVSIDKQPTIKLTPKGTINVLDSKSHITYTLAVSYFSGTVDPTQLKLVNEYVPDPTNASAGIYKNIGNGPEDIKGHFILDNSSVRGTTIDLIVNNESRSDLQGMAYKINTVYVFGTKAEEVVSSSSTPITPKPTQTMPKLTQSAKELTLYAVNSSYGKSIIVKTANNSKVSIDNIAWSKNTSKELRDAFADPIFNPETGKLIIKIKNPALLKQGAAYTLKYCMVNNNQLTGNNVQGTEFAVKVIVK